ncbi:MAG: hypothetical protein SGJ20_01230 [Planctomycetota bacterium]|nr:hypothetical protein [Planctomycetota bacterium]
MKVFKWYMVRGVVVGAFVSLFLMPSDNYGTGSFITLMICSSIGLLIGLGCDLLWSRGR